MYACAVTSRAGGFDRDFINVFVKALPRRMCGGRRRRRRGVAPGRDAVLAGATAWALVCDELAVIEDLAAPHASGFPPINCATEADEPSRASGTQGFRELQIRRCLREPQVGIVHLTRQVSRSPAITPRSCAR